VYVDTWKNGWEKRLEKTVGNGGRLGVAHCILTREGFKVVL
jgi:hypothetical protein